MTVERNAVIKIHKSGTSNIKITKWLEMNRSTVWKIVKKFQDSEMPVTGQSAEENEVSASSTP